MSGPIPLYPLNDLVLTVALKDVEQVGGKVIPLTVGPVNFFISLTNGPTATTADATLVGTGILTVNTAASGAPPTGIWLIQLDATLLQPALLATLFGVNPQGWLIIQNTGGTRSVVELIYTPTRLAIITG